MLKWFLASGKEVKSDFVPQETCGNIWKHFWLSQLKSALEGEARDVAKHPTLHWTAPPKKKDLKVLQNVSSTELKKLCSISNTLNIIKA